MQEESRKSSKVVSNEGATRAIETDTHLEKKRGEKLAAGA